jgi:hypothetical protein
LEGLFIVIILWIIFSVFSGIARKNKRGSTLPRRMDAVEEQRQRRLAYEAAHKGDQPTVSPADEAPYHQTATPYYNGKASEPAMRTVSVARTASGSPRAGRVGTPQLESVSETAYQTPLTPIAVATASESVLDDLAFNHAQLIQGIVMAEVLGPCRAKGWQIRK